VLKKKRHTGEKRQKILDFKAVANLHLRGIYGGGVELGGSRDETRRHYDRGKVLPDSPPTRRQEDPLRKSAVLRSWKEKGSWRKG